MNEYQELIAEHQQMQKRLSDQPLTLAVEEVQGFIKKVREAGAQIRDARQREQLRAILRSWGAFVFEGAGYYPETQLAPYDGPTGPELAMSTRTNWGIWGLGLALVLVVIGVIVLIVSRPFSSGAFPAPPTGSTPATVTLSTPADTVTPSIIVGVVVTDNATLRSSPDASGVVIGFVPRGLKLTVLARSADSAWLKVKAADETLGWIAPGEIGFSRQQVAQVPQGVILLVTRTATPLPTPAGLTPTVTLTPSAATGTPIPALRPTPTALAVNVLAQVTLPEGIKLKVRDKASTAGNVLGELEQDAQVIILEGPTSADGLVWWRVDSRKGLVGWSAEGVGDAKYLVPVGWAR